MTIISSQRHIDPAIVEQKRADKDYIVTISPEFEIAGLVACAMIDGHHSLAAAKMDGVEPVYVTATVQDDDRLALLEVSAMDYLDACQMDSDWYDIKTGIDVF